METNEQPAAPGTDAMGETRAVSQPQPAASPESGGEPTPGLSPQDFATLAGDYPELAAAGEAGLPDDVRAQVQAGRTLLDACRLHELRAAQTSIETLTAQLAAERANKVGAAASTGSLQGGAGGEKSYYSPGEWDRLPAPQRQKFIHSGKIFDFMKKWGK